MAKLLPLLLATLLLTACGAPSVKRLEDGSAGHQSFIVPEPYDTAYRIAFTRMRDCYEADAIMGSFNITGVIFPDIKQAQITARMPALVGIGVGGYYFMTKIDAIDRKNARVTVYYAMEAHRYVTDDVRRWLVKHDKRCH